MEGRRVINLQTSKGLGDALYLRAIALHLLDRRETVTVFTRWPDVFADLPVTVKALTEATGRENMHYAVYCLGCPHPSVTPIDLFRRACFRAGIMEPVSLRLSWRVRDQDLVDSVKRAARGQKIVVFQPLKRARNPEQEAVRPSRESLAGVIDRHRGYFRVRVGSPDHLDLDGAPRCDMDLVGRTTVPQVLDVCTAADAFVGESCFLTVAAEALGKPYTFVFSRRALDSDVVSVRSVTPERMIHRPDLATVVWDG